MTLMTRRRTVVVIRIKIYTKVVQTPENFGVATKEASNEKAEKKYGDSEKSGDGFHYRSASIRNTGKEVRVTDPYE
jgi:hypothetical protein